MVKHGMVPGIARSAEALGALKDVMKGLKSLFVLGGVLLGFLILDPFPVSFAKNPKRASGAPADTTYHTLLATVCACDPEGGNFDLVTGCGFALHEVRISISPTARMTRKGRPISLSDLKPGTLVRVRFVRSKDRNLAEVVDVESWEEEQ